MIKALTFEQIHEEGTYDEIIDAMNHPKAKILKVSRKVDLEYARDYINAARENGISFNTVHSNSYKGPIGLIVASDEAVEVNEIMVETREKRLKKQGLSQSLIDAVGETICDDCFQLIEEKAPEEALNYKRLGLIDKLMGKKCESCEK
ncbi:hypothetical protein ACONDI_02713 [Natranaerofaba carboxydovora]|nr:hypothetical protein ACONDI_02713 [Natranaerofaba carboxydovora]